MGNYALPEEAYEQIRHRVKAGSTILEFGSGEGTDVLAKSYGYKMVSVEHDPKWIDKYEATYIYAPIDKNWYDVSILKKKLPKKYDLIIIDGPTGDIGRKGILEHLDILKLDCPVLIDDINRHDEAYILRCLKKRFSKRKFNTYKYRQGHKGKKAFAIMERRLR